MLKHTHLIAAQSAGAGQASDSQVICHTKCPSVLYIEIGVQQSFRRDLGTNNRPEGALSSGPLKAGEIPSPLVQPTGTATEAVPLEPTKAAKMS